MSPINTTVPTPLIPYLLPGEQVVAAVHHHWARVASPVLAAAAAFVLVLWIDSNLTVGTQVIMTPLWLGFWFLVARAGWHLMEWRHDWFVATDKRLLLRYGLITHKVAMMPLIKVTDMSYVRPIPGQLLGYGRFVMESAGQDQAMRVVNWVPQPNETYRAICAVIFNIATIPAGDLEPEEVDDELENADGDEWDAAGPGRGLGEVDEPSQLPAGSGAAGRMAFPDVPPIHNPIQDRLDAYSRPLPIRSGERFYASEDIRRAQRGSRTGPIPQGRRWRRRLHPGADD